MRLRQKQIIDENDWERKEYRKTKNELEENLKGSRKRGKKSEEKQLKETTKGINLEAEEEKTRKRGSSES